MGVRKGTVFINIPFDSRYERLYVALITGLVTLGFIPHCALEVAAITDRLHRIFDLLRSCEFSIHDLSRVQLSGTGPRCPRFNMPFEAGLALAVYLSGNKHRCAIFEAKRYRLQKSLSDLNGFDPYIHHETVKGMLAALTDLFHIGIRQADAKQLFSLYLVVSQDASIIKTRNGNNLFRASSFRQLVAQSQYQAKLFGYIP